MSKPVDVLNELKVNSWNKCIAPRAESVRSQLISDEFSKGVIQWLEFQKKELLDRLKSQKSTREDDLFIKGMIAGIEQVLELPDRIEDYLAAIRDNRKPTGTAGY